MSLDYDDFFDRATGRRPYGYQGVDKPPRGTAEDSALIRPSVLEVPTGSGKTQALVVSWLPMRSLVEQTADVARAVRERLGATAEDIPVHVLMGGETPSDWREHPERDQILVGTIDMLLPRALARGYGESRFQWPISFGLLNADCRWVFDEVQLMGPARRTSAQLDGLRTKLGVARPCETVWASATVDRYERCRWTCAMTENRRAVEIHDTGLRDAAGDSCAPTSRSGSISSALGRARRHRRDERLRPDGRGSRLGSGGSPAQPDRLRGPRGTGIAADVLVCTESYFDRRGHLVASLPGTILREGRLLYAA